MDLAHRLHLPLRRTRDRPVGDPARRPWLIAWLGGPVIGIVNGAVRELVYKDEIGEFTARQISGGSAVILFTLYFWLLQRRWPLRSTRSALEVGAVWVALTVLFEFGFGRYVEGNSWDELFDAYNVAEGNLWLLVLLWLGVGPAVVRRLSSPGR